MPLINGSKHFTWHEALYLPSWKIEHIPSEEEKSAIIKTVHTMDVIREFLGKSISVHVWIRPLLNNPSSSYHGQDYNVFVHGAPNSVHKLGLAVDWDCGEPCDETRSKLLPKLEEFGLRMEDNPGSSWVHIDLGSPHPNRFFKP